MTILISIFCIVVGFAIGYLIANNAKASLIAKNEMMQQAATKLEGEYDERIAELKEHHRQQIDDMKEQYDQRFVQQMALLREQMNTTSEKILRERSDQLAESNVERLSVILNPLMSEISQMKATMDKSGNEQSLTMENLRASIKANMDKANELSERADKLAAALIGDNKAQGDFGELRLKQMLEDMGFKQGEQFEEQITMRDAMGNTITEEDGHRLIPDVILHFPDQRDVIIDSKVSLKAFIDYRNAQTDDERQVALKRHIASVRSHVNELSRKNYSKYIKEGRGKLDCVIMYVFNESALQLALSHDVTLCRDAYNSNVIIADSQNMYMMLRVLEMTWKQVRQVENQQNIMNCANTIVERVQMFYERFLRVEEQLDKTRRAFDEVKTVTAASGASITTAANKLLKYGAKENPKKKRISPTLPLQEEEE